MKIKKKEDKKETINDGVINKIINQRYRFDNFVELNRAGICTYLMDAPHNQYYQVGHRRIYDLKIPIK